MEGNSKFNLSVGVLRFVSRMIVGVEFIGAVNNDLLKNQEKCENQPCQLQASSVFEIFLFEVQNFTHFFVAR